MANRFIRGQHYSDNDLKECIAAVGPLPAGEVRISRLNPDGIEFQSVSLPRHAALAELLESAATRYNSARTLALRPTPLQTVKCQTKIERAATALLEAIGKPTGEKRKMLQALKALFGISALRTSGPPRSDSGRLLRETIRNVTLLRDQVREALDRNAARGPLPAAKRHAKNEALHVFITELALIYWLIFKRPPGASVGNPESHNAGAVGGPFVRFVQACLAPLGVNISPAAIRGYVPRDMRKSAQKNT